MSTGLALNTQVLGSSAFNALFVIYMIQSPKKIKIKKIKKTLELFITERF